MDPCGMYYVIIRHMGVLKIFSSIVGFLEQGLLVKDMRRLKEKYRRSTQFYLDAGSIFPTDVGYVFFGIDRLELR